MDWNTLGHASGPILARRGRGSAPNRPHRARGVEQARRSGAPVAPHREVEIAAAEQREQIVHRLSDRARRRRVARRARPADADQARRRLVELERRPVGDRSVGRDPRVGELHGRHWSFGRVGSRADRALLLRDGDELQAVPVAPEPDRGRSEDLRRLIDVERSLRGRAAAELCGNGRRLCKARRVERERLRSRHGADPLRDPRRSGRERTWRRRSRPARHRPASGCGARRPRAR